jgi:hypothetical protein
MKLSKILIHFPFRILFFFSSLFVLSCEESFLPNDVIAKEAYVVEGHIELSDLNVPAYVILSKSVSYFSEFDTTLLSNLYITDATVIVNDGEKDVELEYSCVNELDQLTQYKILSEVGDKILSKNLCLYLDRKNIIKKEVGREYKLKITHAGNEISASTRIPDRVKLDSIYFKDPPGVPNDTMTLLWVKISDPPAEDDFYRYKIVKLSDNFIQSGYSLRKDILFQGQHIDIPLPNPLNTNGDDFDPETANLYNIGDTILLKWSTLSKEHYEFWESFQFSNNQGPFSSYVRAKDNIEGGIGIWGAYNSQNEILVIPER